MVDFVHRNFDAFRNISSKLVDLNFSFLGMNLGITPQWNFFTKVDWSQTSSWAPGLGLFLIPLISGLLSYFAMDNEQAASFIASVKFCLNNIITLKKNYAELSRGEAVRLLKLCDRAQEYMRLNVGAKQIFGMNNSAFRLGAY